MMIRMVITCNNYERERERDSYLFTVTFNLRVFLVNENDDYDNMIQFNTRIDE